MNNSPVCISCLSSENKLYSIKNSHVSEIYEKLSNYKLSNDDGIPKTMCYICYSQLQKCNSFMRMSQKAGRILYQHLSGGIKLTPEKVSVLVDEKTINSFGTSILEPTSYYEYKGKEEISTYDENTSTFNKESATIPVKQEPNDIDKIVIEEWPSVKEELMNDEMEHKDDEIKFMDIEVEPIIQESVQEKKSMVQQVITKEIKVSLTDCMRKNKKRTKVPKDDNDDKEVTDKKNSVKKVKKKNSMCNRCGSTFTHDFYLRRHMLTHTGEKRHTCNICNKKFSQNVHLAQHMRVHTGEKPYVCNICPNMAFNHGYNYKTHMRSHTKERSHKCNVCDSAFHRKGDLQRHIRTHTGEKPYVCYICNMKHSQKGHLTLHLRTHTNFRFNCDLCPQTFTQKQHLKYHRRAHTDGKPYPCTYQGCSKAFNTKCTFRIHLRVHSGERPYSCDKCGKTFKQTGHLTTHTNKVHTFE